MEGIGQVNWRNIAITLIDSWLVKIACLRPERAG